MTRLGRWLSLVLALVVLLSQGRADPPYRVLSPDFNGDKSTQMMRSYLRERVHAALDSRHRALEVALTSPDAFRQYQERRTMFLRKALRGPLGMDEARSGVPQCVATGRIVGDGFTIEKLLIESRPRFHLTANLYRPRGAGPFPAILHPVGHSENGKAAGAYQRVNQLLAAHGFIVLCYDPIGQGERKQLLDSSGAPLYRASSEHQQLGAGPILLGSDLGAAMAWDGVRALDYLCSREDVDSTRIGSTGNSGGGNMTSYLMGLDSRIVAAAPGCFMTTHRRKNESPGPGDAEQNIHAQIAKGFDHADFILVRAPRPTLILSATNDFVPIEGSWEAFRQAKRAYSLLGFPERVQLTEAASKHGFSRRLRESATVFFCRWLQRRAVTVDESNRGEARIYSDRELQVTPDGQVLQLKGERSLLELLDEEASLLQSHWRPLSHEVVRNTAQIRPLEALPGCRVSYPRGKEEAASRPTPVVLHPERRISLPGLMWRGRPDRRPILVAPSAGMNAAVAEAKRFHKLGHAVLIVEVRDTGETRTRNWRFFGADYYIAHMLDHSWLGRQAEDLTVAGEWLRQQSEGKSVTLVSDGAIAAAALHAAYLAPDLFHDARLTGGLRSWHSLLASSNSHQHLHQCVHGALAHYDLPQLRASLGSRLHWTRRNPVAPPP